MAVLRHKSRVQSADDEPRVKRGRGRSPVSTAAGTPAPPDPAAAPTTHERAPLLRIPNPWIVVVSLLVGVLAAVLSSVWWAYARPSYVSAASLVIDQPHLVAASLDQGAFAKLEILRNTYAQMITTPVLDIPVSQPLSLP